MKTTTGISSIASYMTIAPGEWSLSDVEVRRQFPQRARMPKMREAMQVYRERKRWKYGVRSRYVVKPELVDILMVHWVHASKGGSREVVVPQSAGVLAHFRQRMPEGIKLTGPKSRRRLIHVHLFVQLGSSRRFGPLGPSARGARIRSG